MDRTQKSVLLTVPELLSVAYSVSELESNILKHGLKEKFRTGTATEEATITSYQEDLRRLISTERVCPKKDRSFAEIDNGKIQLIRKVGKWNYTTSGKYLEFHEALYLMEMNRLEVMFNSVILSLERAYSLFLRKSIDQEKLINEKLSREEYAVYSHLCRCGYIVQKYKTESNVADKSVSTKELCVWSYLRELLGQPKQIEQNIDQKIFVDVKRSMDDVVKIFRHKENSDNVNLKRRKNSSEDMSEMKKIRVKTSEMICSTTKQDATHKIDLNLESIDNIELEERSIYNSEKNESLRITFNLWTDGTYKKTKKSPPNYRIIVLKKTDKQFPKHQNIYHLYHKNTVKVPIILFYVNEELSLNAYIYRFPEK